MTEVEYDIVLHDQGLLSVKVKDSAGLGTTKGVKNTVPLDNANILGVCGWKIKCC